ncbi:hypothetical protein TNCV_147221 [Trichonephila clavipes]|nr:hypothetical protein TNCV_147221 [Trichonephila clavipes]
MDFAEINYRGKRGELLGRIDRQNSRFRTFKSIIIKLGLHASFVELESSKIALNEKLEEVTQKTSSDIVISGDGTWKLRGYTSRVDVCDIIGDRTGRIIDAEVISS